MSYASGKHAKGECMRCGQTVPYRDLVFDGEVPNLRVCQSCYDPDHPQNSMPRMISDPVALRHPAPEGTRVIDEISIPFFTPDGMQPYLVIHFNLGEMTVENL